MSRTTPVAVASLLLWTLACNPAPKTEAAGVGAGAAVAGLSAEDEAAIHAVDTEWARAATAGDGNAIAALYTDDATVLPPNEPIRQGAAAKQYWVDFTNAVSGSAELTTTAVEGRGDLAIAVGNYRMSLTPKQAGAKPLPVDAGKYLEVLRKQADGSWKISHDIWNSNAPAKP